MAKFTGIPELPQSAISSELGSVIQALKEDVELLIGSRGEAGGGSKAVTKGSILTAAPQSQYTKQTSTQGQAYSISNVQVAGYTDFTRLVSDVNGVIRDLAALRSTVDSLIKDLKA
jgi:hypothetical protein